jgi:hypothetical protein
LAERGTDNRLASKFSDLVALRWDRGSLNVYSSTTVSMPYPHPIKNVVKAELRFFIFLVLMFPVVRGQE